MKYQILVERRGFYVSLRESREGFETAVTPMNEMNRGKSQSKLAFRHKAFFEARVRLKDEIDSEKKESLIPRIPHSQPMKEHENPRLVAQVLSWPTTTVKFTQNLLIFIKYSYTPYLPG